MIQIGKKSNKENQGYVYLPYVLVSDPTPIDVGIIHKKILKSRYKVSDSIYDTAAQYKSEKRKKIIKEILDDEE